MSSKFLNILSDKITINKNKLNINTSGLDLDKNKGYNINFPNGIIKDINNKDISNIDPFKISTGEFSTGETSTGETGSTGSTGGTSPTIIPPTITTLSSGRQIYRHESDEASVLIFDMYGTEVHLLIPDCKYRTSNLKWGTYGIDTAAPNFLNRNKNKNYYIHGDSSISNYATIPVVTDSQLQDLWPDFSTDLSAKDLCDIWMTYQGTDDTANPVITGVPAVEYVRSLTISGITGAFDIPNIYELMVMFLEQDAIDNLDKYKSDPTYQNYLLAYNSSNKRWFNNGWVWAASETSANSVRNAYCNGDVGGANKSSTNSIIPVQELSF